MQSMGNTSSLRNLKQNSENGNIFSTFQLYELSLLSKSSDLIEKKNYYFQKCIEFLETTTQKHDNTNDYISPKNQFILDSLVLKDIRKFHSFKTKFERDLTVIIGENGSGKTTILECIAKSLSWIVAGLIKENANGDRIGYSDIKNEAEDYGEIQTNFKFGEQRCSGSIARAVKGLSEKKDSSVSDLKFLADIWRVINNQQLINLPLFIFYSARRFILSQNPISVYIKDQENRYDVYNHSLKGETDFIKFKQWFISLYKKGGNIRVIDRINHIEKEIKKIQKEKTLLLFKEHINLLRSFLKFYHQIRDENLELEIEEDYDATYKIKTLQDATYKIKILQKAITECIPEIEDIYVDISSGLDKIYVHINGKKININQLSDGQKIFLGIVADLTYRLIVLNPNLENPLNGQGIVLIDEIEAHIHPKWQQRILINLTKTFPNIQFIVTTHSPQVLSTVYKRQIRQLVESDKDSYYVKEPEFQTRGVTSSDILEKIMGTNSIPDVKESNDLNKLQQYIQEDKYNTPEAKLLYDSLKKHFGDEHPEMLNCDRLIQFRKLIAKK